MKTLNVYHTPRLAILDLGQNIQLDVSTPESIVASLTKEGFTHVAAVEIALDVHRDAMLNIAYTVTNSLEYPWYSKKNKLDRMFGANNVTVQPLVTRCRSTSVGDVIESDGKFFWVAAIGFQPIN